MEGEQRVHGAVERRYPLRRDRAVIGQEAAASMSLEEHRHGFAAAMAGLLAEFNAYLDREHADPAADLVGYWQIALWLTRDELAELISQVQGVVMSKAGNEPAPGRNHYLLSPILFPIEEAPQPGTGEQASQGTAESQIAGC